MYASRNRGGLKGAVKDIQQHISQHSDAFIYKSDVKSYYASIEHRILHDQLCQLFPYEPILCRLFWQFMQRTVERGGNYRDICKGIPLGSSLSPLLAAIYLIPLDNAFSQHPDFFYRRYMDDWVIICHSRRQLRKITKEVYTIMKSLHVEIHPKKTWLGKVKNGFDFLGFRVSPTTIQASAESVSRRDSKVARLYEQGASKKRIRQYLRRWLGWSILASVGGTAIAAPGDGIVDLGTACVISSPLGGIRVVWPITFDSETSFFSHRIPSNGAPNDTAFSNGGNEYLYSTYSIIPPPLTTASPTTDTNLPEPILAPSSTTTVYYTLGATPANETCTYSYTLTSDATGNLTRSNVAYYALLPPAPSNPTAVPIFTPIGLVATIGGLLWFGRRRKGIKLSQR